MTLRNLGIAALLALGVGCSAGQRADPCDDATFNQLRCKQSRSYRGNSFVQGDRYLVAPVRAKSLAEKTFDDPYLSIEVDTGVQRLCLSLYGNNQGAEVETVAFKRLIGEYLTAVTPGAEAAEIRGSVYHGLGQVGVSSDVDRGESTAYGCLNLNAPLLSKRVRDGVRRDVMDQ